MLPAGIAVLILIAALLLFNIWVFAVAERAEKSAKYCEDATTRVVRGFTEHKNEVSRRLDVFETRIKDRANLEARLAELEKRFRS